jgi:4-hydroxy-tetrahydrodipicolinate synthase
MDFDTLGGIIAPLITPFTQEGDIDFTSTRNEIQFLLDNNVDAISPGGSTGEGAALEDDEICSLIQEIRSLSQTIPIVAGIIRNSTKAAIRSAKSFYAAGADALMITPVSYNVLVPDDDGNLEFYNSIAEATPLPIIIYNVVPQNTISPQLLLRLLSIKQIVGIKQSVGGISAFYQMYVACKGKAKIFSATDEMMATTFTLGADGAISAILSVFPKEMVETWKWIKNGEFGKAYALQEKLFPVWGVIAGNQFPIRIKYALSLLGRNPGFTRSPICHISSEEKKKIKSALVQAGLLK